MNYELCKQLKDAGYKFQPMSIADGKVTELSKRQIDFNEYKEYIRFVLSPTLSELIEACGDRFCCVFREGKNKWGAEDNEDGLPEFGKTPLIAVAKLYLKLHETHKA